MGDPIASAARALLDAVDTPLDDNGTCTVCRHPRSHTPDCEWETLRAALAVGPPAAGPASTGACGYVFGPYNYAKVAGHEGEHIGAQAGGWQLPGGVASGPQATPPLPERDEQIATVEAWGWSRDVSHTAWIPPWKPTYTVHVSTSPLCVCMHEQRHHVRSTPELIAGCSWNGCACRGFEPVVAAPTSQEPS